MAQAFTILFVDDDDMVRAPLGQLLRAQGWRVFTANSAVEAIRIIALEHVDVLFTDVVMPDKDGIELAKQAKLLSPNIRVVFATAYFSQAADAERLGRLLFKPLRAHEIDAALEEIRQKMVSHVADCA